MSIQEGDLVNYLERPEWGQSHVRRQENNRLVVRFDAAAMLVPYEGEFHEAELEKVNRLAATT